MPKISVIIPTYNRAKYIARAIDSVLCQTFRDKEIIVVDDGSTDETPSILASYKDKIRVLNQINSGVSAARNRGIVKSKGQYLAFLDSDDVWTPDKLEVQAAVLDTNPDVGIVYGKLAIVDDQGNRKGTKPEEATGSNFVELLSIGGDLPTSSVMVRRECFERAGYFDETMDMMEDFEMWVRIARQYDLYEITDRILATYLEHDGQVTQSKVKVYRGRVKLFEKFLDLYQNVPDLPIAKMKTQIVEDRYMLAKSQHDERRFRDAFVTLVALLFRHPNMGSVFWKKGDDFRQKRVKLIKPYGLLGLCALKGLIP